MAPEELEISYGASPLIREIAVLERQGALVAIVVPDLEQAKRRHVVRVDEEIRVHLAVQARKLPAAQRLAGFRLNRRLLPRTPRGAYRRDLLPELYECILADETFAEAPAMSAQ